MLIVNRLLVNMVLTGQRSNANIEGILNGCFSCSEAYNFDSDVEKITELLLVLEPVLCGMSAFKSSHTDNYQSAVSYGRNIC
jgi:hypothetical protein